MEKDDGGRRKREKAGEELRRLEKDGGDRPSESLRNLEKDRSQRTDETG